jgi:hypothetical protein
LDGPGRNTSRSLDPLIPKEDYERFKAKARQFLKAHAALYESPFVDISPTGPEGIFSENKVRQIVSVLAEIRQSAAA